MFIKLFWGAPANPGTMRFHTSTLLSKDHLSGRRQFATHQIKALFGVQIGKSFVGRMSLGAWGIENEAPHDR